MSKTILFASLIGVSLILTFSVPEVYADPNWDFVYVGNSLPATAGFVDEFTGGCLHTEIHTEQVYHMISTFSGLCAHLATAYAPNTATGYTVEFKLKINNSPLVGGIGLWATSDDGEAVLLFSSSKIREAHSGQELLMDTTDDFHIYRLTVLGSSFTFYVDGVQKFTDTVADLDRTFLRFGDGTPGASGDAEWDYIAFTTTGSFNPSQLQSPSKEQTQSLGADVQSLIDDEILNEKNGGKLTNTIDKIIKAIEKEDTESTCDQLDKLIKDTQKLINKGDLDSSDGQPIIDTAENIKDTIPC